MTASNTNSRRYLLALSGNAFIGIRGSNAFLTPAVAFRNSKMTFCRLDTTEMRSGGGNNKESDGAHTYVEGVTYDDEVTEILAMGGDPFFLAQSRHDCENEFLDDSDDDEDLIVSPSSESVAQMKDFSVQEGEKKEYSATDGRGPKPTQPVDIEPEEWDGREDDNAHFD